MTTSPAPQPAPLTRVRSKPSLRWRLRHWLKCRLFGNPPKPWEPRTEWGRMRRAERIELSRELERLRALEDRLTRYLDYREAQADEIESDDKVYIGQWRTGHTEAHAEVRYYVVDGHFDEFIAEYATAEDDPEGAELARRFLVAAEGVGS